VRPTVRHLSQAGGLLLLAAVIVYTVSLVMVLVVSQQDQRVPVDAIVVLGAAQYNGRPSPVLRARLDHALELYRDRLSPLILVTGGVGRGDTTSEALAGRRYLISHGVPADVVVAQSEGRTTMASMTAVAAWLHARGLRRALLVSDPFHMFRLRRSVYLAHRKQPHLREPRARAPLPVRRGVQDPRGLGPELVMPSWP